MKTVCLLGVVAVCGCSSLFPVKEIDTKNYYNQQMTGDLFSYKSKGAFKITIEGVDGGITVSTILPMRSIIPRDPGFLEKVGESLPALAGFWFLGNALNQKPTVVTQPQPLVIEPMVVRP